MSTISHVGTLIKGASIKARIEHLREHHGPDVLASVLALTPEADRVCLEGRILASTQYPLALNARLDEAVAQVLNPEDPTRVYRQLGRASAKKNLRTFHRIFLRGQGPHDILRDFRSVRSTYYSDGDASYEPTSDTDGVFRVVGAASHALSDCESTAGYFEQAIELMGGSAVTVVLRRCRDHDHPHCEFVCEWR